MTHTLNTTRTAAVATAVFWQPITGHTAGGEGAVHQQAQRHRAGVHHPYP